MRTTKTVYKGKYPELVDFEITSEDGSKLDITMTGGAITVIITATSFLKEYMHHEKPKLMPDKYSMKVGKTTATTDPAIPPSVSISY